MTAPLNLRLHQLRALVAVTEHGSIRAAARALHLSQAALTKSLRMLEDEAGLPLLIRKPSGVLLTQAGQRLLARARLVTRQMDLAGEEIRQALGAQDGQVRLALTPYLTLSVLGEAFAWFRRRHPDTDVQVSDGLVNRVLPALRDGSLDFAIVADSGDTPAGEFASTPLMRHVQRIVVREGHALRADPSAERLRGCEWLLPGPLSQPTPGSDYLSPLFERAGLAPPRRVTRCDALAAIALVRSSDVVSLFPQPLLDQPESRGICAIDVPGLQPEDVQLVQVSRADVPLTPAADWFARCLRDACAAIPADGSAGGAPAPRVRASSQRVLP